MHRRHHVVKRATVIIFQVDVEKELDVEVITVHPHCALKQAPLEMCAINA